MMYRELFEDLRKISSAQKGTQDYLIEIAENRSFKCRNSYTST